MKRVAINGFGRIGRAFTRVAYETDDIEIVAINDLMDTENAAYLLKYDSVYGTFAGEVEHGDGELRINGKAVPFLSVRDPQTLPWKEYEVDVVIEATGVFASYEKAQAHRDAGAKHVIITAPVKDTPPKGIEGDTILIGINTDRAKTCSITSNASCTTNAVGIPMNALHETIGIESAILNTVHGYTATQPSVDSNTKKKGNMRYGRAAAINIVPATTGAAVATTKAIPDLEGKFDGIALRVPVPTGSIADITFVANRDTSVEEVNSILKGVKHKLFSTTDEQIVSSDIVGAPYVAIADLAMTRVVNKRLVKVLCWYDNERGYTQSLIEHTREL